VETLTPKLTVRPVHQTQSLQDDRQPTLGADHASQAGQARFRLQSSRNTQACLGIFRVCPCTPRTNILLKPVCRRIRWTAQAIEVRAVDETSGSAIFALTEGAMSYDVIDEVVGRAILTGARFLALRRADIPDEAPLVVILR
jgi:hypothetical protein